MLFSRGVGLLMSEIILVHLDRIKASRLDVQKEALLNIFAKSPEVLLGHWKLNLMAASERVRS